MRMIALVEGKADTAMTKAKESLAKANAAKMEASAAITKAAKNEQTLIDLKAKIDAFTGGQAGTGKEKTVAPAKETSLGGIRATGHSIDALAEDGYSRGSQPPFVVLGSVKMEDELIQIFLDNKSGQVRHMEVLNA